MNRKRFIFFSYASTDIEFALRLAADLKNAGVHLWLDRFDLPPNEERTAAIQQALSESAALITVLSPDYVASESYWRELAHAGNQGIPFFPALVRSWAFPEWIFKIQSQQSVDFSKWQHKQAYWLAFNQLVSMLRRDFKQQMGPPPDRETIYLNSLLARIEVHKGLMERAELYALAGGQDTVRDRPGLEKHWGVNGPFSINVSWTNRVASSSSILPRQVALNNLQEALKTYPRFVLAGAAGTGKTTTLYRLAQETARARRRKPNAIPLPLLLHLAAWQDTQWFGDFIRAQWPFESDPLYELAQGELVLYLDGLDELGARKQERASELREWLHGDTAPQRVVITCREEDYSSEMDLGLPVVAAGKVDSQRARRIVTHTLGPRSGAYLLDRLKLNNGPPRYTIFDLAVLTMLHHNAPTSALPGSSGAVLLHLMAMARARVQRIAENIDPEELEEGLARLAFHMLAEELPALVPHDYVGQHLGSQEVLQAADGAGLLRYQERLYGFGHPLLRDYFAALLLAREGVYTRLKYPQFDARDERIPQAWDGAVVVLAGLVSNPDYVVREVAEIDPYLAAACIYSGVALREHTCHTVAEQLVNIVEDTNAGGRVAAARALGMLRAVEVIPRLLRVLALGDHTLALAIVDAFAEIGDEAIPRLVEALRARSADVRAYCVEALKLIDNPAAVTRLTGRLLDEESPSWTDRRVCDLAAEAIEGFRTPEGLAAVRQWRQKRTESTAERPKSSAQMAKERHQATRAAAAGQHHGAADMRTLITRLEDVDWSVRRDAVDALAQADSAVAVPLLLKALRDPDSHVRWSAVKALEGNRSDTVIKALLEMLHDEHYLVSDTAAEVLVRTGSPAVPGLLAMLEHCPPDVRGLVIEALGQIGDGSAVPAIVAYLDDSSALRLDERTVGQVAVEALRRIGTAEALEALENRDAPAAEAPALPPEVYGGDVLYEAEDAPDAADTVYGTEAVYEAEDIPDVVDTVYGADEVYEAEDSRDPLEAAYEAGYRAADVYEEPLIPAEYAVYETQALEAPGDVVQEEDDESEDVFLMGAGQLSPVLPPVMDELPMEPIPLYSPEEVARWQPAQPVPPPAAETPGPEEAPPHLPDRAEFELDDDEEETQPVPEQREQPPAARKMGLMLETVKNAGWGTREETSRALREFARSLRGSRDMAIIEPLLTGLSHEESLVRWTVIEALAWVQNPAAVPYLLEMLGDKSWTVRVTLMRALAEIGEPAAAGPLLQVLSTDAHHLVREAAAEALGVLGDASVVPGLRRSLSKNREGFVRRAIVIALGRIGDGAATDELMHLLEDPEDFVCWAAIEALGRIRARAAVPRLIAYLEDNSSYNWDERRLCDVAAQALESIGTPEALRAVAAWRQRQAV